MAPPSDAPPLVYYDIACKVSGLSWAPNPLKVRYVLNYKKIPYQSVFLSMPDIAENHKRVGIPPHDLAKTSNIRSYTCGAIQHGNVKMQEGATIVDYLEKTWPNAPSVYPFPESKNLSEKVASYISKNCLPHLYKLLVPRIPDILDEKGAHYFIQTRTKRFGVAPAEFCPPEEFEKHTRGLVEALDTIAAWLQEVKGPYLQGPVPIYADFIIAAHMTWALRTNPDVFDLINAIEPLGRLYDSTLEYRD